MRVFVLTGPTGVGKSETAVVLARSLDLDIVGADSRQVYRGLDIGTAKMAFGHRLKAIRLQAPDSGRKPSAVSREPSPPSDAPVRTHMIDVAGTAAVYTAADYARAAEALMRRLLAGGRRFIVVGGSGFYLRALFRPFFRVPAVSPELRQRLAAEPTPELYERLRQLDPERAAQLHPNDRQRVMRSLEVCVQTGSRFSELARASPDRSEFVPEYAVLTLRLAELDRRIDRRFDAMLEQGLLDEVRRLRDAGLRPDSPGAEAFGYAELLEHLEGRTTLTEAVRLAKQKTRAYARRQLTWLRGLPGARWYEFTDSENAARRVRSQLEEVLASAEGRE